MMSKEHRIAEREQPVTVAVDAGGGERYWFGGESIRVLAAGTITRGAYALMEITTPSRVGPPLHIHSREDEAFYVVEGQFLFKHDNYELRAKPGTTVFLPRGTTHTYTNMGPGPGKLLVIVSPAGFEGFFAAVGHPEADPASQPVLAQEQLDRTIAVAREYGNEIVGPPLE